MCGGSLEIHEGSSVAVCEYCGTEQTIPKAENEQIVNLLNRANHFRQIFEFDKAMEIYEKILEREDSDPEIYWSIVLCRYGIEYVDDPLTGKKIATCHRTQYASILEDQDYLEALNHADALQKTVLEKEAEYIDKVQKDILQISRKEKPFDVFICYKETDENGERTIDSTLAQEIYYQLKDKGYKVFFSRITLEDKLGQKFEPYIFAALNSAKVMVVVGTKPEYFNAVWVKNEWNRYLAIMQNSKDRLIIPAYRDMDPYDLPDALSYFQAQDMSKIGFMQDLIRGIDKVLKAANEKPKAAQGSGSNETNSNVSALLKRGELALEDGEWDKAFDYYDQVLNINAVSSEAYLGQSLAKNHAHGVNDLIAVREKRIEKIKRTGHRISCDNEFLENLNKKIEDNLLNTKAAVSDEIYYTEEEAIQKLIDEENGYFTYDKLLSKAARFSDDKSKITALKSQILDFFNQHLERARAEDERRKEEAITNLQNNCKAEEDRIDNLVRIKDEEYQSLCKKYNDGQGQQSRAWFRKQFKLYGKYKDAKKRFDEIDLYLRTREERLENLQNEHWEIMDSFRSMGLFDGKKRKLASARLNDIDAEIAKLKEELAE